MSVRIITGDCLAVLRTLDAESVHCVVTSPPYWGLRDYGVAGQLGMEKTLGEHLAVMVEVFREVRRVLRKDGTCWVNYGDCYATSPNGRSAADTKALGNDDRTFRDKPFSTIGPIYVTDPRNPDRRGNHSTLRGAPPPNTPGRIAAGGTLKPKDLCMISNRFAIALQDDGWWVRSEIVWHKPNPMPESVTDRPATAHEKVWLLTKSERYWYDAEAVRIPAAPATAPRAERANTGTSAPGQAKHSGVCGPRRSDKQRGHTRRHQGFNDRWDKMERAEQLADGANLRNVWTIATAAFSEAHFATFPPALIEPCIKAGCPVGGTVLDPFGGSGTTGLVADQLGRSAILIELNPEYAAMAHRRIKGDAPLLTDVVAA